MACFSDSGMKLLLYTTLGLLAKFLSNIGRRTRRRRGVATVGVSGWVCKIESKNECCRAVRRKHLSRKFDALRTKLIVMVSAHTNSNYRQG